MDDRAAEKQIELVEFSLASESYAIESSFVREVYPLTDLTPLPCTPAFVLGIVNVRGEIVSVIDVRKFFDLPQKGLTDLHQAIILHSERMTFAEVADLIIGVISYRSTTSLIDAAELRSHTSSCWGIWKVCFP